VAAPIPEHVDVIWGCQLAEPIVRVSDVRKTFGGTVRALDGISLEFQPGIIYGLLGPNGAGKTTLIRVLTTLLQPDSGAAYVAGIDVLKDPAAVRRKIGLAGQSAAVDDFLTGRENVEMVGRLYGLSAAEARRRAAEVLQGIRLSDAANRPARTYSGGMRRRLDLAASLVGRPEVLFLDEPTTGIDPRSRLDIWDMIRDLAKTGTTVLLTTQYLDEADTLADRVAVIDRGRLISEGTAEELKDRLGGSVIEVAVEDGLLDGALQALAGIDGVTVDRVTGRISMPALQGSRTLIEAIRLLSDVGIAPDDVALHKPTLDTVFLALTGQEASEAETLSSAKPRRRGRKSR
jgi:ABC-2 type transport system ATP-binding protein